MFNLWSEWHEMCQKVTKGNVDRENNQPKMMKKLGSTLPQMEEMLCPTEKNKEEVRKKAELR